MSRAAYKMSKKKMAEGWELDLDSRIGDLSHRLRRKRKDGTWEYCYKTMFDLFCMGLVKLTEVP
jgi:hypothetical protein